jgi:hypothetical protein
MLIKNKELIRKISYSLTPFDFSRLSEKNMCDLSSIFLRFKPIFLAFKANGNGTKNKPYINKLRRLAKVNHTPMAQGFWQTIFTEKKSVEDIIANAKSLPNYKKVALMQTCLERSNITDSHLYIVRNQKAFLRENYTPNTDVVYNATVYALLRQSLVESLKANSTKTAEVTDENGVTTTVAVPKVVKIVEGLTLHCQLQRSPLLEIIHLELHTICHCITILEFIGEMNGVHEIMTYHLLTFMEIKLVGIAHIIAVTMALFIQAI